MDSSSALTQRMLGPLVFFFFGNSNLSRGFSISFVFLKKKLETDDSETSLRDTERQSKVDVVSSTF